ncbi:MAG: phosphatase PAP2 family protein, partial [Emcibacteraceae bacterium]|nr:phosphatase PAP2 family protein [Emcibacteraceae bacterium]
MKIPTISELKLDPVLLKGNVILLGMVSLYCIAIYGLLRTYSLQSLFKMNLYNFAVYYTIANVVFIKAIRYIFRYLAYDRKDRGVTVVITDFKNDWFNANYLLSFAIPILCLPIFISAFSSVKSAISLINPFYLDEFFMMVDRKLHFGVDPWKITFAVFGSPLGTVFLNFFYNLWFFVMYGYTLWVMAHVSYGRKRLQFLIAFILSWAIVGSLLAILFSSAGPVYYGRVVGDHSIYSPLMDSLYAFNEQFTDSMFKVFSLNVQELLWENYLKNDVNIGSGISAMPSMHLAVSTLLYLSGRQLNAVVGYLLLALLMLILIGSVHL